MNIFWREKQSENGKNVVNDNVDWIPFPPPRIPRLLYLFIESWTTEMNAESMRNIYFPLIMMMHDGWCHKFTGNLSRERMKMESTRVTRHNLQIFRFVASSVSGLVASLDTFVCTNNYERPKLHVACDGATATANRNFILSANLHMKLRN